MSTLGVTPGVGDSLLTDPVTEATLGTGKVGPVKVAFGAATTITLVDATHPLPVTDTGGSTTLLAKESGGNLDLITASASVLDDWDESDRAKVNIIVGQAGVAANTGTVSATTQRVTLATDVPLPTGSNTIGAVTGTVTVNAGTNLNTSALALEAGNLATLSGTVTSSRVAVNLISGVAGVAAGSGVTGTTVQRVVLATDVALPAGTNTIGAVTGAVAIDAAITGAPVLAGVKATRARPTAMSADGDTVYPTADRYGRQVVIGIGLTVVGVDVTASGDTALIAAPGAGSRLNILRVEASNTHATTALTAAIKSPSLNGGTLFGKKYLPAAGGLAVWNFPLGYLPCGDNESFSANLSAAGTVSYTVYYETILT